MPARLMRAVTALVLSVTAGTVIAQESALATGTGESELPTLLEMQSRLDRLEQENRELRATVFGQPGEFREINYGALLSDEGNNPVPKTPARKEPAFYTDYDKGFRIKPFDKEKTPFELQINGRMQARYVGFHRDRDTFATRGGPVLVEDRNDFEIERGRLEFTGYMWDPNLGFYINTDTDTDDNHRTIFHDFWVNYQFSEAFNLHFGKAFVPGSREWLNGSTKTHLSDRSMSNTFFRPDRSIGLWAIGEVSEGLFYRAMLGNGFNTQDLDADTRPRTIDTSFVYAASVWWDICDNYGKGYADLEWHEDLAVVVGSSFTFSDENGQDNGGPPRAEEGSVRISDGTLLTAAGALTPGATVNKFDIYLLSVDFAIKYQGWSFNSEYYFRWLNDFSATGAPLTIFNLYDDGFAFDLGYMIVPKKFEVVGRVSTVDGAFGDSWEYAGGVNWYLNGDHTHKLTTEAAVFDGVPVDAASPNLQVGQDGVLFTTQYQVAF